MIKIENLNFNYSPKQSLFENLNLNIEKSGIVGLFGKNGAGKTTLLKLISGIRYAHYGTLNIIGYNPANREPGLLKDLFFVPEQFDLPNMKVSVYLWMYACGYPDFNEELFYRLCERFELDSHKKLTSFSMGQRKKFMIAFALASGCRLILLDEPTNGLDIPSKKVFRQVVAETISDDQTIIISTHYVSEVEQIIDRFVVLDKQQIKFNGGLDDISQKFVFTTIANIAECEPVYYEEELNGHNVILPNDGTKHSKVNLELFFNAVVSNNITLN